MGFRKFKQEVIVIIQMRDDDGLNQGGSIRYGEKGVDLVGIFMFWREN